MLNLNLYKSNKYTSNSINSCYILHLCLIKKLNINIINIIKLYLLEYTTGFASFNKKFIINNIEYDFDDRVGHPIDYIPRLLSKFPIIMSSSNDFSKIIQNINNVPNIKTVDLTNLYNILFKKKYIKKEIINPGDFSVLLSLINQYICKLNIIPHIEHFYKQIDNKLINYTSQKSTSITFYIKNINYYNIEDMIIDKCGNYTLQNVSDINNNFLYKTYEKLLLSNSEILYIELLRIGFNGLLNNKVIINKIINLPPFVFIKNNEFNKYELIALMLYHKYDDNNNLYSLVIKENNNKFYYYNEDEIYEIDDNEFDDLTAYNCTHIFYKKIN